MQTPARAGFTLRDRTGSAVPAEYHGGERRGLKAGVCRAPALGPGVLAPLADLMPSFLQEALLRVQEVRESVRPVILYRLPATAGARGRALAEVAGKGTDARRCFTAPGPKL